jgi:hypothetical protein
MVQANKATIRSVVVNGNTCELQLTENASGKWAVFGCFPTGGGSVIAGCKSLDNAVEQWLLGVTMQKR